MLSFPSSSRSLPRPRGVDLKDDILKNLNYEVRSTTSGNGLSPELREALEGLDPMERRELVNTLDSRDSAPLFHASRMGNAEICKYLVETCGADLEQHGTMDMFSEDRPHVATPLWVASVYGSVSAVAYLLSQGANVNARSNTGSTPVRSACFMSNTKVVQLLVESGADIFIRNQCGGSCLVNAIQTPELCRFLLFHGAEVNGQDIKLDTALHYAVMERRLETAQLLMEHGADIFLCNALGQSPLQMAAIKGSTEIYQHMSSMVPISPREESDMLELMGFYFLQDNKSKAKEYWVQAAELREREGIQKPSLGYSPRYASLISQTTGVVIRRIHEYTTKAAWESIAEDPVMLEIQGLLIAERILGNFHKDFLKSIEKFGSKYSHNNTNYFLLHEAKSYGLQMQFLNNGNGILSPGTSVAMEKLLGVYTSWRSYELRMIADGFASSPIPFELLMESFQFLIAQLPEVSRQISFKPYFPGHRRAYDTYLLTCSHLLSLLFSAPRKREELKEITMATQVLVTYALPLFSTGDTLLHLAMRRFEFGGCKTVPKYDQVLTLLHCGSDVNAMNQYRESSLHILLKDPKYNEDQVAEVLVTAGAHLDQLDSSNFNPLTTLLEKPFPGFPTCPPIRLECMTAKVIGKLGIPFSSADLPQDLMDFVINHAVVDSCDPGGQVGKLYQTRYGYY